MRVLGYLAAGVAALLAAFLLWEDGLRARRRHVLA